MKKLLVLFIVVLSSQAHAQTDERISTLQFVQIVDGNLEEALYYYEKNWKSLRDDAIKNGMISSYEFIRTEGTEDYPIDMVLITTYANEDQFNKREENFAKIMEGRELDLLNELKPDEFRTTVFVKEPSIHAFK